MASSAVDNASNNDAPYPQQEESASGTTQWQHPTTTIDTAALGPASLPLTRVPRAWERRPLSPFSRSKMRVGKVWKRAATGPVEIRSKTRSLGATGKPVKKMRLDDGGGASVARWEGDGFGEDGGLGSPVRKIVLRRDRVGEEGLVALAEEEDDDVVGGRGEEGYDAVVEVFDEEGTLLDVDPEAVEEQREWVDEEVDEVDEFNPTMMHLGDVMEQARHHTNPEMDEKRDEESAQESLPNDAYAAEEPVTKTDADAQNIPPQSEAAAQQQVVLPEGFVSPVKQDPGPARRTARKSVGSRRRTLPIEWRPSRLRQSMLAEDIVDGEVAEAAEDPKLAHIEEAVREEDQMLQPEDSVEDAVQGGEHEWEDIADEEEAAIDSAMDDALDANGPDASTVDTPAQEISVDKPAETDIVSPEGETFEAVQRVSPSKLPSSPVPSVEGPHPRLPLRRTPRRKSTSPAKQRTLQPLAAQSHLVAFTPIKGRDGFSPFTMSPHRAGQPTGDASEDVATPVLERPVSAPPEEPAMSPHRPSRPRVSDDTALLQAFLNRVAETKSSGRRISATKQESITNRRDSDAVRQALASPAKPEVLTEMDPNSPSPRKNMIVSDEIDDANILPDPEPSPEHKTRRSGRAKRTAAPQTATPAAANKITIRRNSENVVLKKSEAQELSHLTRTNTRKNKGGSVLPLYRLAKLQQQGVVDPLDDGAAVEEEVLSKPNSKGRSLRWNEILVEVWQGGDVSETSMLSDELSGPDFAPVEADKMEMGAEVPTFKSGPPPPAETPSKPKIRRLKAPRTAATPGKAPAAVVDSVAKVEPVEKAETKAPAPTKRRSRIATPAKGLGNSSLLPADLEPTPAPTPAPAPQAQQPKKSVQAPSASKRKAPASRLPAPASVSASATTAPTTTMTSALDQGKENLISSPPKKKPASTAMPSAKTFAPKLDFEKSLPPSSGVGSQDDALPGLASPAKKVGRRGGVMFAPSMSGSGGGGSQEEVGRDANLGKEEVPWGLRSPAKKRTRRAVGGAAR